MKKSLSFLPVLFLLSFLFIINNKSVAQEQLTNLPTLYITTDGYASIPKNDYVKASITIKSSVTSEELNMITEIRGRGNSTWGMQKKPYRIKLETKEKLLGMPANARSWVLLANYADKSLIRNALAFKIGEMVDLEYTPKFRFVDLVLNGQFLGNYILTDQIEVRKNRVPVEEQEIDAKELPAISGGYLLEINGNGGSEPKNFSTPKYQSVVVKYPKDDEINQEQFNYIKGAVIDFEKLLYSTNFSDPEKGFKKLVDESALVNWYIASELTGNSDCFWSTYFYKYRDNEKFYFGPMWDYDIAFNNDRRLGNAEEKLMRENAHNASNCWAQQMWRANWFRAAVKERWLELIDKDIEKDLINFIDITHNEIDASQKRNYNKWKTLGKQVYQEYFVFETFEEEINYLKTYLHKRVNFLTEIFTAFEPGDPQEFFIPENHYYAIYNKRTYNCITVPDGSMKENAKLELWGYMGMNPFQDWIFKSLDENKFQIINRGSNLAIAGNGKGNNLIQVKPNINDPKQQWYIICISPYIYGIVNEFSSYSVNNSGGSFNQGTPAIEYDDRINESENQQWYLKIREKIEDVTGIEQFTKEETKIYPNPVNRGGMLYIKLLMNDPINQDAFVELYDLNGKSLDRQKYQLPENNLLEISLSNELSRGIYIVKIRTSQKNYIQKLIIH